MNILEILLRSRPLLGAGMMAVIFGLRNWKNTSERMSEQRENSYVESSVPEPPENEKPQTHARAISREVY